MRKMRRLGLVPLGLVGLLTGCMKEDLVQSNTPAPTLRAEKGAAAKDGKKRAPKAATCVSAGIWFEQCANCATAEPQRLTALQRAKEAYQQALEIEPRHPRAMLGMAHVFEMENNITQALSAYGQCVRAHPAEGGAWFEYGMCWARQKQWEKAIPCLQKACDADPANTIYQNTLAWTFARAERYDQALAIFTRLMGSPQAYYRLGLMAKHLGRDDLSKQYVEVAVKLDPQLTDAVAFLAQMEQPAAAVDGAQPGAIVPAGTSVPVAQSGEQGQGAPVVVPAAEPPRQ